MIALVTGAAGFLGSHLSESLLESGHRVVGMDAFTPYYDRSFKEANLRVALGRPEFAFHELDLRDADLEPLLAGVDWVFHQAAQPGVRASWGESFTDYADHNLTATQRLLEASREAGVGRFIYASSSSVYGSAQGERTAEDDPLLPLSPYGVTKLGGEHLVGAYHREFGLPTVALRYFTVCGPRQRPDMAFHRILRGLHEGTPFTLLGDGEQERDFTFVGDVVRANLLAAERGEAGRAYNIGGGRPRSLRDAISVLEEAVGRSLRIERRPRADGDPRRTAADITRAREELGYQPEVPVEEALRREAAWFTGPEGPPAMEAGATQ